MLMKSALAGKKLWLFICLVMFLAGCGADARVGSPEAKAPASAGYGQAASQPGAYPSSDFGGGGRTMSTSEAPSSVSPSSASPAPPPPAPMRDAPSPQAASKGSSRAPATPVSPGATADAAPRERSRPAEPTTTPAPESRPGLGTEFGEARSSRVHDVSFAREAGRPFAIAALNYNDKKGVDALASVAARRDSARSVATGGGAVTISVRDANGDPLEAVHVGDRTFVVGQAGQRYSIVLENHTGHRFEAVGTVDGLDVINGKPGTFDNRGYVLMPFATLQIEGFRTSTSAVAAFRFAAVSDSYAAQTGSARNVGVIGIALFSERGDSFVPESETRLRDTASPFPADPRFAQPPRR